MNVGNDNVEGVMEETADIADTVEILYEFDVLCYMFARICDLLLQMNVGNDNVEGVMEETADIADTLDDLN